MITADDVFVGEHRISRFNDLVHRQAERVYSSDVQLQTYGKDAINLSMLTTSATQITSYEIAMTNAKFVISAYKHSDAFVKALPRLMTNPSWDGKFKHSGLISNWNDENLHPYVDVKPEAIARELDGYMEKLQPANDYNSYLFFRPTDDRLTTNYSGNPSNGIVQRALWALRRRTLLTNLADVNGLQQYPTWESGGIMFTDLLLIKPNGFAIEAVTRIKRYIDETLTLKPQRYEYENMRSILLRDQEAYQSEQSQLRRRMSGDKFAQYWSDLKRNITSQDPGVAHMEFASIAMLEPGTKSSRTWGIEIETVRADQTSRPAGWTSTSDGSLPSGDGSCDCSCDSCYDGDHCDDSYENCYDGDNSSREFVSPILSHFNSSGLRQLCNDLGTVPDEDEAPGIHVHVGASDLSVPDVTNVMLAYSAIEPLLKPLLHRKAFNYCKPTSTDTLRWWLAKVREFRRVSPDQVPQPRDFAYDAPNDRYLDVNLQSLAKHGTIEFRAMGAWYDYDHLSRWAWLVRELVNVSKLGIDQREWTRCRSLADVVALLCKYGSEIPNSTLIDEALSSKDFDLSSEIRTEALG